MMCVICLYGVNVQVVGVAMGAGERGRESIPCPLMYTWHGRHYLGAAHGLAGIMTLLLQVSLSLVLYQHLPTLSPGRKQE